MSRKKNREEALRWLDTGKGDLERMCPKECARKNVPGAFKRSSSSASIFHF